MLWNWELPDWPDFNYTRELIAENEKQFLLSMGSSLAFLKNISETDYHQFTVEILSAEGVDSSKIEGEVLDRESLQSSIKCQFGINSKHTKETDKEARMARVLHHAYETFEQPLTHEMLWKWHALLFDGQSRITDSGRYRTHQEPMQIVPGRYDAHQVFFEAPPSNKVYAEMTTFLEWFNSTSHSQFILGRAAIAHVYFESIHPFEDGNGRIGRVLIEKVLSQGVKSPVLIAVSKVLEKHKKEYYVALERCNRTLQVDSWVHFFSGAILQAQIESIELLYFLIEKAKLLTRLVGQLNERQEKVLVRMFREGPTGFQGGLSAEKYMAITKASRATTTRDLVDLVEKEALRKTGELRHTRYYLNIQRPAIVGE